MESLKKLFSDSSQQKKIIIAAIAIPVIGYSIYRLIQNSKELNNRKQPSHQSEKELINSLIRELQKLGKVVINPQSNLIPFETFLDLYAIIRHYSKARIALRMHTEQYIIKRREFLQNNKMDQYWQLVEDQNKQEDDTYNEISQIVYGELNLPEQVFQDSQQQYLMDPNHQQMFYQFQMQQEMQEVEKNITNHKRQKQLSKCTKEDVIKMLEFSEELKIEAMQKMENRKQIHENSYEDQIHQQSEIMMMQTYMADQLFLEFGIEEDEFNRLIAEHNLFINPAMQDLLFGGAGNVEGNNNFDE